jgi:5-oxoprolinase (ATP-hydrolysing)
MATPGRGIGAEPMKAKWQFWIDRGGTFTDIVARRPDGRLVTHKLLSENPEFYVDAAIQGIRDLLQIPPNEPIASDRIQVVRLGTTVATNALLERKGEPTLLITTEGFADALRIAYQQRPKLFALKIERPEPLYEAVVEVRERIGAHGELVCPLDLADAHSKLRGQWENGLRACAIVLMHSYRYPQHELALAKLARQVGFTQVSMSHEASPLMKFVARGDTAVVDAYLSPVLRKYVDQLGEHLPAASLQFMQSSGGLTSAERFRGKDAVLSGPAGGVVGAVQTSIEAGLSDIIAFDMGGTSTDVTHFAGEYERSYQSEVAGVRLRAPVLSIHTVAAGGGSICSFNGARLQVGPQSAGAVPGPVSYRRGGPLTVTDCNVMLGKLRPEFFPRLFGDSGDAPLDAAAVSSRFAKLAIDLNRQLGGHQTPADIATGFLQIAVDNMANAIKKISVQNGYDVSGYTLVTFGGAGGQHACLVADALGIKTVFIHPLAGVLSAYGMGLADVRVLKAQTVEASLDEAMLAQLTELCDRLGSSAREEVAGQCAGLQQIREERRLSVKYTGTDSPIELKFGDLVQLRADFERQYRMRYGFLLPHRGLTIEAISVEAIGVFEQERRIAPSFGARTGQIAALAIHPVYCAGAWRETPFYDRTDLRPGDAVDGPAVLSEAHATTVVEPGWQATLTDLNHLFLRRTSAPERASVRDTALDPVRLELFNNLFMSIAQQMGVTLAKTAHSVNIKERMDFSCALFDCDGQLIANAPHMPVHLGSMGESVQAVLQKHAGQLRSGDVYIVNAPYAGGTHLPDITAVMPVFYERASTPSFFVAARGHHADIGGITPGSMPASSVHIDEEGVLIDSVLLVRDGKFRDSEVRALFGGGRYPARDIDQNIADLRAQVAACQKGSTELARNVQHFGLDAVKAYMGHVQDHAEESVRRAIDVLQDGTFECQFDQGSHIRVAIRIDRERREATIDFSGSSAQQADNFNAPQAVARAAVLYVFRTLAADDIPMNAGCARPLRIILPHGSIVNPRYPAAVVAGNVETSQVITDALYGALGIMAASQGTMNNFTFGNDHYQYYETICGGSGAGCDFDGCDAIQTHMTNSRLTDPEVLEWRFPVRLDAFRIRRGSGGSGRHRGGDGVERRVRFLTSMIAVMLANRRGVAPFGLCGGDSGKTGRNWVERANGAAEQLGGRAQTTMNADDVFVIQTPGGGGFGAVCKEGCT